MGRVVFAGVVRIVNERLCMSKWLLAEHDDKPSKSELCVRA